MDKRLDEGRFLDHVELFESWLAGDVDDWKGQGCSNAHGKFLLDRSNKLVSTVSPNVQVNFGDVEFAKEPK